MRPYQKEWMLEQSGGEDDWEKVAQRLVAQDWCRERLLNMKFGLQFLRSKVDVAAHGTPEAAMKWTAERVRFLGIDPDSAGGQLLCLSLMDVDANVMAAFTSYTTTGTLRPPPVPTTPVSEWTVDTALGMPTTLEETFRAVVDTQAHLPNPRLVAHGSSNNVWPCFTPPASGTHRGAVSTPAAPSQGGAGVGGKGTAATATVAVAQLQPTATVSAAAQPFRQSAPQSHGAQPIVDPSSEMGAQGHTGAQSKPSPPSLCPKCKIGYHWARFCPSFSSGDNRNDASSGGRK